MDTTVPVPISHIPLASSQLSDRKSRRLLAILLLARERSESKEDGHETWPPQSLAMA